MEGMTKYIYYLIIPQVHLQRVRKAESLAERSTSNGPLRAQSNEGFSFRILCDAHMRYM